jgi:hypothetical protein
LLALSIPFPLMKLVCYAPVQPITSQRRAGDKAFTSVASDLYVRAAAMVHYLDEARSIDARRVMAGALKSGRGAGYDRTLDWPDPVCRDQGTLLHPTLTIDLQWPALATDPVYGTVLIRYPGTNGQVIEQRVQLTGTPARIGGLRWQNEANLGSMGH